MRSLLLRFSRSAPAPRSAPCRRARRVRPRRGPHTTRPARRCPAQEAFEREQGRGPPSEDSEEDSDEEEIVRKPKSAVEGLIETVRPAAASCPAPAPSAAGLSPGAAIAAYC
eukprot:COSAG04_NODE_515_length_13209_cov_19.059115_10_plen_112_part_00